MPPRKNFLWLLDGPHNEVVADICQQRLIEEEISRLTHLQLKRIFAALMRVSRNPSMFLFGRLSAYSSASVSIKTLLTLQQQQTKTSRSFRCYSSSPTICNFFSSGNG
jgi:hypothetical protein